MCVFFFYVWQFDGNNELYQLMEDVNPNLAAANTHQESLEFLEWTSILYSCQSRSVNGSLFFVWFLYRKYELEIDCVYNS